MCTLFAQLLFRFHVTVVMTVMAVSVFEMYENAKLAREMAVMGNYESSGVYYEGTLQQINRLVMASDQSNKQKWLSVSIAATYSILYAQSYQRSIVLDAASGCSRIRTAQIYDDHVTAIQSGSFKRQTHR